MSDDNRLPEIKMDAANLYREEVFTDRKMGTILRMTPVTAAGTEDRSRPVLFIGQAQLLTPLGSLPLSFTLDAKTLEEAIAKYPEAARNAMERTIEELKELRREAASSIIIPQPGAGGLGGMGGPMGPGGRIPGGKIQLP